VNTAEMTAHLQDVIHHMEEARVAMRSAEQRIDELEGQLGEAHTRTGHMIDRIQLLETALQCLVTLVEDTNDNTEGRYPGPEPSCNECTGGLTPIDRDKGLCAYHHAKKLLKRS